MIIRWRIKLGFILCMNHTAEFYKPKNFPLEVFYKFFHKVVVAVEY